MFKKYSGKIYRCVKSSHFPKFRLDIYFHLLIVIVKENFLDVELNLCILLILQAPELA